MNYYLAIDIGASSGRHIIGWQNNGNIETMEVYRFSNGVKMDNGHLIWDIEHLFNEIVNGIRAAFEKYPKINSLSIDTWGVDYVLLKDDGEIFPCYAYRDDRTKNAIDLVHSKIPFEKLYSLTGIQHNSFNTIYQLYDDLLNNRLKNATDFLMMPEYFMYKLSGKKFKEYTDATTTGIVNAKTGEFDKEIINTLGLPEHLFKKLSQPSTFVGNLKEEIAKKVGGQTKIVLCATHDTASAVEGIPMKESQPYISSGTWSLFGIKTEKAFCDEKSLKSNYSNEGGFGYNRYQKNIMGLWMVQSLQKELCKEKFFVLIAEEAATSNFEYTVDANDETFLAPTSMKKAIEDYLLARKMPAPKQEKDYFNCVFLSLAKSYAEAINQLEKNLEQKYNNIYIVGGGAKNKYLNNLTQKSTGKNIIALPIEATAIGNLKIQIEADKI